MLLGRIVACGQQLEQHSSMRPRDWRVAVYYFRDDESPAVKVRQLLLMSCSGQMNRCGFRQEFFPTPPNEGKVWKVMSGRRVKLHFCHMAVLRTLPETRDKDGPGPRPPTRFMRWAARHETRTRRRCWKCRN